MRITSVPNPFGRLYMIDLGPRSAPDRAAWSAFNDLRNSPACVVDHVYTPVHTPGSRATPLDHRMGECILTETLPPSAEKQLRRLYANVAGARLHI